MPNPPSSDLLLLLGALRDQRWSVGHDDTIERDRDAFLIHLDAGAAYYLTRAGAVLVVERWREATTVTPVCDDEARDALAAAACHAPALRALLAAGPDHR